jgi:hypothetical protein
MIAQLGCIKVGHARFILFINIKPMEASVMVSVFNNLLQVGHPNSFAPMLDPMWSVKAFAFFWDVGRWCGSLKDIAKFRRWRHKSSEIVNQAT